MLIDGHGYDSRSSVTKSCRRSKITRVLHPNGLARFDEEASEKIESLLNA
jgi:hypothetical protein